MMEDEGYTSPHDEHNDLRFLDSSTSRNPLAHAQRSRSTTNRRGTQTILPDIEWDKVIITPREEPHHLGWDDIPPPYPYHPRDLLQRNERNKSNLAKSFVTDSATYAAEVINNISKLLRARDALERCRNPTAAVTVTGRILGGEGDHVSTTTTRSTLRSAAAVQILPFSRTTRISFNEYIHHALHLVAGRESITFSCGNNATNNPQEAQSVPVTETFFVNPNVLVNGLTPTALANLSGPFLNCGNLFRKLSYYANLEVDVIKNSVHSEGSLPLSIPQVSMNKKIKQRLADNPVFAVFLRFIAEYLKVYQTIVILKGPQLTTLTKLTQFMKPLESQLVVLNTLLDKQLNESIVQLLASINQLVFSTRVPFLVDLLQSLFISCATAYFRSISDWVFHGVLSSTSEFHIEKTTMTTFQSVRHLWTHQFTQTNELPLFLKESGNNIFDTGKAINLIGNIKGTTSDTCTSLHLEDSGYTIKPELSFEKLINLNQFWISKLSSFLDENSSFSSGIQVCLDEVTGMASKRGAQLVLDLELQLKVREERELKFKRLKDEANAKKIESKKKMFHDLSLQIQDSKQRKKQQLLLEKEEARERSAYNDRKDEERAEADRKHAQKTATGDHGYRMSFLDPSMESESKIHVPTPATPGNNFSTKVIDPMKEETRLLHETSSVQTEGASTGRSGNLQQIQEVGSELDQSTLMRSTMRNFDEPDLNQNEEVKEHESLPTFQEEEIPERKFNPDNVIVTQPPPYNRDFLEKRDASAVWTKAFENSEKFTKDLEGTRTSDSFCLNHFLSRSISIPVTALSTMMNLELVHVFIVEHRIVQHASALNDFLCLRNGLFGHSLCEALITEVRRQGLRSQNDVCLHIGKLNMILVDALSLGCGTDDQESSSIPFSNLAFAPVIERGDDILQTATSSRAQTDFNVLNFIRLHYRVDWPLNTILTDETIHHYERVSIFLLQLLRSELLLNQVFYTLKSKRSKSPQLTYLNYYRYRLHHFVRTVRNYVNVTVIDSAWAELCSKLYKVDSIDRLYEEFVHHIKSITTNCLLGPKAIPVLKLLISQLQLVETFCCQLQNVLRESGVNWDKGEELSLAQFRSLTNFFKASEKIGVVFLDVAFKLARKGIYPKVGDFLDLYNFNGFFRDIPDFM